MMIAVQSPGLVMDLLTVKIRLMAVTLPVMIMMVVTEKEVLMVVLMVVLKESIYQIMQYFWGIRLPRSYGSIMILSEMEADNF